MIPEYNKIDFDNDTVDVIKEKISAIKKGVADGSVSQSEMEAEKTKLDKAAKKLGYAFNW